MAHLPREAERARACHRRASTRAQPGAARQRNPNSIAGSVPTRCRRARVGTSPVTWGAYNRCAPPRSQNKLTLTIVFMQPQVPTVPLILASDLALSRQPPGALRPPLPRGSRRSDESDPRRGTPAGAGRSAGAGQGRSGGRPFPQACVIGGDQVAVRRERDSRQAGQRGECREQLERSPVPPPSSTPACTVRESDGHCAVHLDTTAVHSAGSRERKSTRYVEREQPFDCAGGFKAEALGITLFERIESRIPRR